MGSGGDEAKVVGPEQVLGDPHVPLVPRESGRQAPCVNARSNRIPTTHAGSLPRTPALHALHAARFRGDAIDPQELASAARDATRETVERQIETGLSIINNGEVGRESFITYLQHRMTGFGGESERRAMADLLAYPGYLQYLRRLRGDGAQVDLLSAPKAVAEIRYEDPGPIERECDELKGLLAQHADEYLDAFVSSPSPGIVATAMQNEFYEDLESYVGAVAAALRVEYGTIVKRGLLLQIDAPDLALERHTLFQDKPLSDFVAFVRVVVDALNDALEGLPPERVRLHVCWGNYPGPHDQDVPLEDIWSELTRAQVGAMLLSMANPRHAHEYRLFEERPLPEHLTIIPGVIDTTTNYVEHPETVADRLERIAHTTGAPERLIAGTDCGLETSAGSTNVVPDVAWAKLRALVEGAQLASRRLFG